MDFKFSNEILFVGGFIIILVLFIQYMMYSHLKKQIKIEIAKIHIRPHRKNTIQQNIKDNVENKKEVDNDSIDVDTPESEKKNNIKENNMQNKNDDDDDDDTENKDGENKDDDSYVNPVHSEKNIDD
jgi:hypothetical protein